MQRTRTKTFRIIAGSAFVGPGLFVLLGTLDRAASRLTQCLDTFQGKGLGLLSSIILAASFDRQALSQGILQMLVSCWPLLPIVAGVVLWRDASAQKVDSWAAQDADSSGKY